MRPQQRAPATPPARPPLSPLVRHVAEINRRFARGRPSSHLAEAGVLVHMFEHSDGTDQFERMWLPCASQQPWCAAALTVVTGDLSDRPAPKG